MPDTLMGDAWSGWVEERTRVCCHLKIWPLSLDSATSLLKALSVSRGTCKHVTIAKQQQSFFLNYMTSGEIIARNANHWIISGRDILKVLEITLFHCEVLRSTLFQYCKVVHYTHKLHSWPSLSSSCLVGTTIVIVKGQIYQIAERTHKRTLKVSFVEVPAKTKMNTTRISAVLTLWVTLCCRLCCE